MSMKLTRLYLVLDQATIDRLRSSEGVIGAGAPAYAPTPALVAPLRSTTAQLDAEDEEFAAFCAAVGHADTHRRAGDAAPAVIAAADVETGALAEPDQPVIGRVRLTADVALRQVAAFHVEDVSTRDPDTGQADPVEFLWYDVTELDQLPR